MEHGFPLLMIQRSICKAVSSGPAVMGRAWPLGLAGNFVIPGGQEGFLEEVLSLFFFFYCAGSLFAARGLSLFVASRGYSSLSCGGFSCGAWGLGEWASAVVSQGSTLGSVTLWCADSIALQHVESSQTRNRTRVPCIDRRILNHWTTRDVHKWLFHWTTRDVHKWLFTFMMIISSRFPPKLINCISYAFSKLTNTYA